MPIYLVMQFYFILFNFRRLCHNEISIRNLYACVVCPRVVLVLLLFLSHYQTHSIGIFILAYFAFHLVKKDSKRVISMHFNYFRAKILVALCDGSLESLFATAL